MSTRLQQFRASSLTGDEADYPVERHGNPFNQKHSGNALSNYSTLQFPKQSRLITLLGPYSKPQIDYLGVLLQEADLTLVNTNSIDHILERVSFGGADAVLVDLDLVTGWPTTAAEQLVEQICIDIPVVFLCQGKADALYLGNRFGDSNRIVVCSNALSSSELVAIVKGAIATKDHHCTYSATNIWNNATR